jgi:hypothetical protein
MVNNNLAGNGCLPIISDTMTTFPYPLSGYELITSQSCGQWRLNVQVLDLDIRLKLEEDKERLLYKNKLNYL